MEHYLVSARKYRPATFADVVGQQALTATLSNAISSGRLAHSYLFCGSRGVGKTSCARIFAKTINCEHPLPNGEACNECSSCRSFNEGRSLNILEMDAASNNTVDDMHRLVEQVMIPPNGGRYRVFIIDEVHMLSSAAFNAFLKTLEEPPAHAIFILATTEKHKIIPTILSRCQIYDFSTISIRDMVAHMQKVAQKEGIEAEPSALGIIARKADGAMRDALSIFDQVAASTRGHITYAATLENLNVLDFNIYSRMVENMLKGDVMATWLQYKEIRDHGFDSHFFINGLADFMRDLAVARDPSTLSLLDVDAEAAQVISGVARQCSADFLFRAMSLLNDADLNYRQASNKQFLVELTLAKLCQSVGPSSDNTSHDEGQVLRPIARPDAPSAQKEQPQQPSQQPSAPPQPAAAAPTRPGPHRAAPPRNAQPRATAGIPSLRAALGPQKNEKLKADSQESKALRNSSFETEALIAAWKAFAEERPSEKILINTMRASLPEAAGEGRFTVTVNNQLQLDEIQNSMPVLLQFVRDRLDNDSVTFELRINDGDIPPSAWTDREVLAEMIRRHKSVADLIEDFKLTLL